MYTKKIENRIEYLQSISEKNFFGLEPEKKFRLEYFDLISTRNKKSCTPKKKAILKKPASATQNFFFLVFSIDSTLFTDHSSSSICEEERRGNLTPGILLLSGKFNLDFVVFVVAAACKEGRITKKIIIQIHKISGIKKSF
jgi:hypothetical protein